MVQESATLGGGCFWCLEAVFLEVNGVQQVVSGYAGGDTENPTYKQICTGTTGHAEVVQVTFDPQVIPYLGILEVLFSIHDPTTLNRQGADIGSQYRSVILYHSQAQYETAKEFIGQLTSAGIWDDPIVTELIPLDDFYPAEEYHQRYFEKNPYQGYCMAVVKPKVLKFRKEHSEMLRE